MATMHCLLPLPTLNIRPRRSHRTRCSSNSKPVTSETPPLLRIAVNGVTELLRIFSPTKSRADYVQIDEPSISGIDDVIVTLRTDYERAYFITGNFTSALYADECSFEDPTIKFRGKELYLRNLELLVPFFDRPSLELQNIEKDAKNQTEFILATWKLRTYLKLPWRPLISIEGQTIYNLDNEFKIVRHVESWNISALAAISQIFTPSSRDHVE